MNWFDYFLITVIGLSVVFAAMRGFLREVISLVAWVVAFVAATQLGRYLEPVVQEYVSSAGIASILAFVGVFIGVLLLMAGLGWLLQLLASSVGLSWMDRMLGMVFGLARGILVVTVGFLVYLSFRPDPPELVSRSQLAPHFVAGARQLGFLLPEGSVLLGRLGEGYTRLERQFAAMGPAVLEAARAVDRMGRRPTGREDEAEPLLLPGISQARAAPVPPKAAAAPTDRDAQELERLMKDLTGAPR